MVRCETKNVNQKDMCSKEIGLRAQDMLTILGSILNMIEADPYDHLMRRRIFTLIMNKMLI